MGSKIEIRWPTPSNTVTNNSKSSHLCYLVYSSIYFANLVLVSESFSNLIFPTERKLGSMGSEQSGASRLLLIFLDENRASSIFIRQIQSCQWAFKLSDIHINLLTVVSATAKRRQVLKLTSVS